MLINPQVGIKPAGNHVLVKPEPKSDLTKGGIAVPEEIRERHELKESFGTLIDVGPEAWADCKDAWAEPGQRIMFGRHAGIMVNGKDGEKYRIINDLDIIALVDDEVTLNAAEQY